MQSRITAMAVAAAAVFAAPAAAQQVSGAASAQTCIPRTAVVDTTTAAARVNVGGGSVPQTEVNNAKSKSTKVSRDRRASVDSSRIADIPDRNSERTAVKVNVGGGSEAITRVNTSTKGDSTHLNATALPTCPDSVTKP